MRKLVVTMFMALDGVVENPTWTAQYWNQEIAQFKQQELFAADALLLGRVTYQGFAAALASQAHDDFSDRMNGLPKYVVSSSLESFDWHNSHLLSGDLIEEVQKMKASEGQDILVSGSIRLVHALMKANLVDQFNIIQYPIVLGGGQTLFGGYHDEYKLKLVRTIPFSSGAVALIYERLE